MGAGSARGSVLVTVGRLEAQITIPTGGWAVSVTITSIGTFAVTVAAGTYYPTDLLSTFATQLNAATGADGVFAVSGSFGESGTGLVTISHTVETFTLTWTSTSIRDALGFTGTLTPAAASFTGARNAQGVWLPACPMAALYGSNDPGHTETDMGQTVSPRGDVHTTVYETRTRLPSVRWSHVARARARVAGETVVGESYEQWWRSTQGGELSYFASGSAVRIVWDANVSATYHTYRLVDRTGTEMQRAVEDWNGLFSVEIAGYRVPGT